MTQSGIYMSHRTFWKKERKKKRSLSLLFHSVDRQSGLLVLKGNSPFSFFSFFFFLAPVEESSSVGGGGGGGRFHCLASEGVGIEAVCRCAAGKGHLLSPCGHCHNRQGNLERGLPAEKRPLWTICRPWPTSFLRRVFALETPCLSDHLKRSDLSMGCLYTRNISVLSLSQLSGISSFPTSFTSTCTTGPRSPPPSSARLQLRSGLNFFSRLCDLHVFRYESCPHRRQQCTWRLTSGLLIYCCVCVWGGECQENVKPKLSYSYYAHGLCVDGSYQWWGVCVCVCMHVCIGNQESHLPQQLFPGEVGSRCTMIRNMICACAERCCTWLICCTACLCGDSFVWFCCVVTVDVG